MATRNRYAEIMAQYAQSQPYSFFGYTQSYTGGYDATAYTPAAVPVNRYADIMAQPAMAMGGGRGMQDASGPRYNPLSPLASPELGSPGLQFLDAYGRTIVLPGAIPSYLKSQSMLTSELNQAGINAAKAFADAQAGYAAGTMFGAPSSDASTFAGGGFGAPGAMTTPTGAGIPANPMSVDPAQAKAGIDAANARIAQQEAQSQARDAANAINGGPPPSGERGGSQSGGGYGGGAATGGNNGDASGGGDRGTRGGFAQGGHVSMMHLQGPNPAGPDDGYGALKDGEYVINDKAVKKYGIELMNAINSGKISKGKLRGLLEM